MPFAKRMFFALKTTAYANDTEKVNEKKIEQKQTNKKILSSVSRSISFNQQVIQITLT